MDRKRIQGHIQANHDNNGNAWCHIGTCKDSYQAYQINIWGLLNTEENKKNRRSMVHQQAIKIQRYLEKVNGMYSYYCVYIIHMCGFGF